MSYFSDAYPSVRLPHASTGQNGFRRAQLGSIHAIAAHFSLRNEPAVVVMPTGSGKTAVLYLAAYILLSKRCLIITPSRMVRTQIADGLASLDVLKKVGALPPSFPSPKVFEADTKLATVEGWRQLEDFDAVVATPNCVSPGAAGVAEPPADLFDLVLVDEAHHSPARTWKELFDHFGEAKRVLFTATPFRRDSRELEGRFIYTYSVREAYKDGIFGEIEFVPVEANAGLEDIALARKAEEILSADRSQGLEHRLMVRTDSKARAEVLQEIYAANTRMRMRLIHSEHSLRHVTTAIANLRAGTLDGIICVAMLGEGFDLPSLKVAAIHAPHKSLAVTLQFIGRFARTTGANLGRARFIAVPRQIDAETKELYEETAVWQDIVQNLSAARIEQEAEVREVHDSFEPPEDNGILDREILLSQLSPYCHVMIYQIDAIERLRERPTFPRVMEIIWSEISEAHSTVLFVTRQTASLEWTDLQDLAAVDYDLHVIHHDRASNLLFINSSCRSERLYQAIAEHYSGGTYRRLPLHRINRAVRGLRNLECFNIGMRNRVQSSATESYRIIAGSAAQRAVSPLDGRLYHRGHIFARGESGSEAITIGYSSASKVWSNRSMRIGELVRWCRDLARNIASAAPVSTGSNLDLLDVGEAVDGIPEGIIAARWPEDVYVSSPRIRFQVGADQETIELASCEIEIVGANGSVDRLEVSISHGHFRTLLSCIFANHETHFGYASPGEPEASVINAGNEIPLWEYLNDSGIQFYLSDFSLFDGISIFRSPQPEAGQGLRAGQLESVNWAAPHAIDITREFNQNLDPGHPSSIQDYVASRLLASASPVVLFDHGTGEVADFVSISRSVGGTVTLALYHCKGSGGPNPGNRVGDVYEVAGQVAKCVVWLRSKERFTRKLHERVASGSTFLRGSEAEVQRLIGGGDAKIEFEVWLVQPGISAGNIEERMTTLLLAADNFVARACGGTMKVLCSA